MLQNLFSTLRKKGPASEFHSDAVAGFFASFYSSQVGFFGAKLPRPFGGSTNQMVLWSVLCIAWHSCSCWFLSLVALKTLLRLWEFLLSYHHCIMISLRRDAISCDSSSWATPKQTSPLSLHGTYTMQKGQQWKLFVLGHHVLVVFRSSGPITLVSLVHWLLSRDR